MAIAWNAGGPMFCAVVLAYAGFNSAPVRAVAAPTSTDKAESDARFDIYELRVIGNSKLSEIDVDEVIYPFLGPQRTLKDVEAARTALEALYHERGFGAVFVDIPEQTVDGGLIRLRVAESTLERVTVVGTRYFSNRQIRAALPAAQIGETPQLPALQAQVSALNTQTRDRQVIPILKAGSSPGTVNLNLKVEDHLPLHASLELNNQYTVDTEPLRAIAAVSYDNLFGRLDSLSGQFQTSPQDAQQVQVWAGSYTTHLSDGANRLTLFYYHSNSSVATLGSASGSLTVLGRGSVAGARLTMPLPVTGNSLQTVTLGVDYKDFNENINQPASSANDAQSFRTPITYVNLSAGYSGGWLMFSLKSL